MQAVAVVHDTDVRELAVALLWLGARRIVQDAPFHDSARTRAALGAETLVNCPTAMQAVDEAQDTPPRELSELFGGLDCCVSTQSVPFHHSARLSGLEAPSGVYCPTAMQASDEAQETESKEVSAALNGVGIERFVQLLPFHELAPTV
jgi:hypothetical protein